MKRSVKKGQWRSKVIMPSAAAERGAIAARILTACGVEQAAAPCSRYAKARGSEIVRGFDASGQFLYGVHCTDL